MNEISMLDYIKETPQVVIDNIDNRKELVQPLVDFYIANNGNSINLIASGSSYNGCLLAQYFMRKYLKAEVNVIPPFTFVHHQHENYQNSINICLSQSGCSTNTIECLQLLKSLNQKTVSIVGRNDCDMAKDSDLILNWGVGEEKVGFVTKGVITLGAYLMLFALEVAHQKNLIDNSQYELVLADMKKAMHIHPEIVENTFKLFEKHKQAFTTSKVIYLLSSGPNLATITEGGLKISETCCLYALTKEAEEFLHGPIYPTNGDTLAIFVDNNQDSSSHRIIEIAKANQIITNKTFAITNDSSFDDNFAIRTKDETDSLVSPLYKLAALQTLAYLITENTNKFIPDERIKAFKKSNAIVVKSRSNLFIDLQKVNG